MDAEALQIILKLKEENVLLRKGITNAALMLATRKKHLVISSGTDEVGWMMRGVYHLLDEINGEQKSSYQPESDNALTEKVLEEAAEEVDGAF
jgi:hypothetical protein